MDYVPPATPQLWQPSLTQFPTSNVACINCCKIVRTVTTYAPGPKGCFLGSLSFILGCWCCILLACSYFEWLHVKHYCPYCDYKIGEYKGRNNIVMNQDAVKS